jgi:uncharacterized protein (DUF2147 family)
MKPCALLFLLLVFSAGFAQKTILGRWKTIDDESGKAISVVEIYESKGKIYGRVAELLIPSDRNKTCSKCGGSDKDKPVMGLVVIKGLVKEDGHYKGKILDPKHGRVYQCTLQLESKDKLKVRGYVGISLLGRTQYWHRVK